MRLAFDMPMNAQGSAHNGHSPDLTRNYSSSVCDDDTPRLYREALIALTEARVPFLVGGAYALARYTGIERFTKDLDIFVAERDCRRTLRVLDGLGCHTELTFRHWLGKAVRGDGLIDIIYGSGNGVAMVDEDWFTYAQTDRVCDLQVLICPPEELVWSKAFVMERERFDGADVLHVFRCMGPRLNWPRLIARFGDHWRVLLSHIVTYGFVYPSERHQIPRWVGQALGARLAAEWDDDPSKGKACFGSLLSRQQYLRDIDREGFADGRLVAGVMTPSEIAAWTAAIDKEA
jgi:hypothetical protein